jgi:hypothetical protein
MASLKERLGMQKRDVWHWRRVEDQQIDVVQAARRAYERNKHSAEKHKVEIEEIELTRVRTMLDRAENKYEDMQREWGKLSDVEKQLDYWRDRTQDLHRAVERQIKIVQRLRRENEADKVAAKAEIELVHSVGPVQADKLEEDEDDDFGPEPFGTDTDAATATLLGEPLVFTNKKELTEAEAKLVYLKGLWHHAQLMLKRARKRAHPPEPSGGDAGAIVAAAKQCEQHSNAYHYSQLGSWRVGIFPGPEPWGVRSDCSQFVTKCFYHAKVRDPNGAGYGGGWTGTLGEHGTRVSGPRAGDLCLVGSYPHHHVELVIDGAGNTIGHGDRYVNRSSIYNFSPRTLRRYV